MYNPRQNNNNKQQNNRMTTTRICSVCKKVGHRCDNKFFHPDTKPRKNSKKNIPSTTSHYPRPPTTPPPTDQPYYDDVIQEELMSFLFPYLTQ